MWNALCWSDDTCRPSRGPRGPPCPAEEADQIHSHQGQERVNQNMFYQYINIVIVCMTYSILFCFIAFSLSLDIGTLRSHSPSSVSVLPVSLHDISTWCKLTKNCFSPQKRLSKHITSKLVRQLTLQVALLLHLQYGLCLKNEQLFFKWNLTTCQITWKSCSSFIKASSRFYPFCSAGYPQYYCVCLFLDSLPYLISCLQDEVVRLSDPCRVWEHEVVSSFSSDGLSPTEGCLKTEQCRGHKPAVLPE